MEVLMFFIGFPLRIISFIYMKLFMKYMLFC